MARRNRKRKNFHRVLTGLGYAILGLLMILITVGLVAYGQGYSYDLKTARLIRTGLVLIQSTPSGAMVSLNGRVLKKKTAYRASFEAGSYTFELTKDGFQPWKKTLQVIASEVTLAQYALLVPSTPKVTKLDTRDQVLTHAISKDHRHLVYVTNGVSAGVYTLDPSDPKPTLVYAPKAATADHPAEVVMDATWSDDASHLLVTVMMGPTPVYYHMTASGTDVINLTDKYRFNFTGLTFSGTNWRQLYWISPDGLRRLDVDTQSVSGVLADKVSQFAVAGDRVLYVQTTPLGHSLRSVDSHNQSQELVQALVESDHYALAYTTYRGQDELAVVPSKTRIGTLYSAVFSPNPVAKTLAHDVGDAVFAPDGHLLTFSASNHLTTYDLERSTITHQLVAYEVGNVQNVSSFTWFDNFHLLLNQGGRLVLVEYDGANATDLGALVGALPGYATADLRSVVSFRPEVIGVSAVMTLLKP